MSCSATQTTSWCASVVSRKVRVEVDDSELFDTMLELIIDNASLRKQVRWQVLLRSTGHLDLVLSELTSLP